MSRLNRLPELLTEVRWKETSVNFRIGIATGDVITDNLPCMRFLNSVNTWIGNPGSMPCPFNSNPRKPSTTISDALPDVVSSQFWEVSSEPESSIVLLGRPTDGDGNRWVCRLYDPQTGLGRLLGHCKRRPLSAVACLRGGRLLLIGGFNGENEWGDAASRLDELDARSGLWRPLSPMRTRRAFGHTATVIQLEGRQEGREVVVVCGGEDEKPFNVLSSCELYDPRENRWWSLPDMQVRRCGAAAAALSDGRLFVFGGGREGSENSVEFCRLGDWHKLRGPCTSSFWRHAAPMSWCSQWRRYEHAAAAFRNRIFVAGGWPDEQEVQIFRPPAYEEEDAPGQWTRLILPQQHMNNQRSGLSLLVHKNRLFALGGDGWNSVEEFSPGEGEKEGAMTDNFESWHWLRQKSPANIDLIMSAAVIEF
ncbi:hypothetical protein AAHC03_026028 [Spirometra sp. Aus1]|nr:unnamed protein product [Spirometra erinaceieuropaei]